MPQPRELVPPFPTSSDKLYMGLFDKSPNESPSLVTDAAIAMGEWTFVVMTYDGTGGPPLSAA